MGWFWKLREVGFGVWCLAQVVSLSIWCSFSRLLGLSRRWVEAWLGTEVQRCELGVGTRSGGDLERAEVELVGGRLLRVVMFVGFAL